MNKAQDVFYLPLENAVSDEFSLGTIVKEKEIQPPPPKLNPEPLRKAISTDPSPTNLSPRPAMPSVVDQSGELSQHLNQLAGFIANVTEAYTVAIFLADNAERVLCLGGVHTLSRDFISETRINFGCGLIGWTAENAVRISVCPFEHDSRTLLCYSKDQDLKSFIAVPILDNGGKLLGVISCDSKKNYAFAKVTEKILADCAQHAAVLVTLVRKVGRRKEDFDNSRKDVLDQIIERLNTFEDESGLLQAVTEVPAELVKRDAFVVVTTAEWGVGPGKFYSSVAENHIGHRLLDMVCRHKKIICGDRSVHALPLDDTKQRSFLSIPFHVLGREAGSFNLLSRPREAFTAGQIVALETIAKVVGRQLERLRLREKFASTTAGNNMMSWKHFAVHAKSLLADAEAQKSPLTLLRMHFRNLFEIEDFIGTEGTSALMTQIVRLAEQTVRPPAIGCAIFGPQLLVLSDSAEAERMALRFRRLLERINTGDYVKDIRGASGKLGTTINRGMEVVSVRFPLDGRTLAELTARSRAVLETGSNKETIGVVANAGNW